MPDWRFSEACLPVDKIVSNVLAEYLTSEEQGVAFAEGVDANMLADEFFATPWMFDLRGAHYPRHSYESQWEDLRLAFSNPPRRRRCRSREAVWGMRVALAYISYYCFALPSY